MASSDVGWFLVDSATGQPVGPYDMVALQGLISSGHLQLETPIWCEGQPEWLPLQDTPQLKVLAQVARDLKKATAKKSAPEDELAAFQAEIEQIEAQAQDEADGGAEGQGPATPEELEFEDDDGTTYVWDHKLRKYMPKGEGGAPPDGAGQYNEADMVFVAEEEVIPSLEAVRAAQEAEEEEGAAGHKGGPGPGKGRKRPAGEGGPAEGGAAGQAQPGAEAAGAQAAGEGGAAGGPGSPAAGGPKAKKNKKGGKPQAQEPQGWFDLKTNTSIYLNGLPLDVTVDELHEVCSKFGLIKEDDQRRPRIKLYKDADGSLKGDALVTFLKEPSVPLAVNLLDGTQLRPGSGPVMSVQPARFEQKGEKYVAKAKAPTSKKAKKAVLEKQEKLLSWGGYDDKAPAEKVTVVLRHMFTPVELASELGAAAELEEEVTAEAAKIGPVEKVRVYKDHPEGVVSLKFKQEEHAQACRAKMDGRFFGGRQISATMWDGLTNFAAVKVKESAEEEEARLEAYARELEARQAAAAAAQTTSAAPGDGTPAAEDGATAEQQAAPPADDIVMQSVA